VPCFPLIVFTHVLKILFRHDAFNTSLKMANVVRIVDCSGDASMRLSLIGYWDQGVLIRARMTA
jgi:hypothetical protein